MDFDDIRDSRFEHKPGYMSKRPIRYGTLRRADISRAGKNAKINQWTQSRKKRNKERNYNRFTKLIEKAL
jgi:hypothetical protein